MVDIWWESVVNPCEDDRDTHIYEFIRELVKIAVATLDTSHLQICMNTYLLGFKYARALFVESNREWMVSAEPADDTWLIPTQELYVIGHELSFTHIHDFVDGLNTWYAQMKSEQDNPDEEFSIDDYIENCMLFQ